jgi:hypothetical protein
MPDKVMEKYQADTEHELGGVYVTVSKAKSWFAELYPPPGLGFIDSLIAV